MPEKYRNFQNTVFSYIILPNRFLDKYSFKAFLKTDDDCYLNIEKVATNLEKKIANGFNWWGKYVQ